MLPTPKDYTTGCTKWGIVHRDIRGEVSHHGVSDYQPLGTWCYYVNISELMFQNADDWVRFDLPNKITEWNGSFRSHFPYDDVPDLDWHGGVTFGERHSGIDKKTGNPYSWIKLGCDYGHSFDQDAGYPYSLSLVTEDLKRTIDVLRSSFPMNSVCGYSGMIDTPDKFYQAINGSTVHVSKLDKMKEDGWDSWLPAS